jgi:hypothetical protein
MYRYSAASERSAAHASTKRAAQVSQQLAPNEERYILAEALTGAVLMMPALRRLDGPLDTAALQGALNHLDHMFA